MTPDGSPPTSPENEAAALRERELQRAREVAARRAEEALLRTRALDESPENGAKPAKADPRDPARKKADRRQRITAIAAVVFLLSGVGVGVGTYYFDQVSTPSELPLPESTTVYYADGQTPMAKLGTENRTLLKFDQMNDAVKEAVVAAEDQTFWTNEGIDFKGVVRAAWNNVTGGELQGASTITQQYARVAAELQGVSYSRKTREAIIAWKLDDKYSKEQILEFYLNTVPFGRGAFGIEAAAQAFMGKTANKNAPAAQQVTVADAMVLVAMIKQPEPNPDDPEGAPGYDPTRNAVALQNSKDRWNYVRQSMVAVGYLTQAEADALQYPNSVKENDQSSRQSGLDLPTGLVVNHVLSELRQAPRFKDKGEDYIENGGFKIITTVDKRAQEAAENAADITRSTAPAALRGQPKNWQAGLVSVEPGTGRILAYYGGSDGTGSDYSGWYYDAEGNAVGYGQHPPGSSFKIYDLIEALRQKVSLSDVYDAPASKEFPASGRTKNSPAGPVRNSGSAACQPGCTLSQSTVASLNVPFFELTEKLGLGNVIESAARAGIDSMWANVPGQKDPVRVDLRGKPGAELASKFSTEAGIGQYGITVMDHANGVATLAAGGKRAQAHFVRSVEEDGDVIYEEKVTQTDVGLTSEQIDELNATLDQVNPSQFSKDWDAAGKTGTWQYANSTTQNSHVWMVGYTRALAAAVWVGTKDGGPLITKGNSSNVFGATYAGPIWQQYMATATEAMKLDTSKARFNKPVAPTPSAEPSATPDQSIPADPDESPEPSQPPVPPPSTKPTTPPTPTPGPSIPPQA